MVRSVRVRGSGSRGGEDGEDRISQLPEEIIHSILNRLESPEEAAGTSVLSRRWLQLWRRYPFFVFPPSKSKANFRSFVASSSRKLQLPLPPWSSSDSDHSCCATIQDFSISLREEDGFRKEDLDRLLSLIANRADGLSSPVEFVLRVKPFCHSPFFCYSLRRVPNWSRTKSITLSGCDLAALAAADHDSNGLGYLGSLERLTLEHVNLGEQLLHRFLDNAPRLVSLSLDVVYGIDRLRISSPKLKMLSIWSGLEELEIDAPDLVSLSWTVCPDDPVTKVNLVNLPSTCRSEIRVSSRSITFSPRWLRASLSSSAFNQLLNCNV